MTQFFNHPLVSTRLRVFTLASFSRGRRAEDGVEHHPHANAPFPRGSHEAFAVCSHLADPLVCVCVMCVLRRAALPALLASKVAADPQTLVVFFFPSPSFANLGYIVLLLSSPNPQQLEFRVCLVSSSPKDSKLGKHSRWGLGLKKLKLTNLTISRSSAKHGVFKKRNQNIKT